MHPENDPLILRARTPTEFECSRYGSLKMRTPSQLPIPDLEGRPINVEDFRANTPEKLELLDGYLFDTPEHAESRRQFLGLLLVNVGLLEAVRLVPEERWREALRRVYRS